MPVVPAVSQSTLPHAQADGLVTEPSVVAHAAGREQVLDAAVQTVPVPFPSPLLVQALLPQMHGMLSSALLGPDPSVISQADAVMPEARNKPSLLHVLSAAMQNIPVVLALSQSAVPHAQLMAPSFAEVPSLILQDAEDGREQVLDAAVQTVPVPFPSPLPVHALFPQMQGAALLGADPSVFVQAEAVTPEA